MANRSARWSFTLNNPGDFRPAYDATEMAYLVYQLERGVAGGTEHLQGYVRFKNRKQLNAAKHFIADTAHMAVSQGSEEQNKNYCTKADTRVAGPWEFGTYDGTQGQQGRRSDLKLVADLLVAGQPPTSVFLAHPETFAKYPQGLQQLALLAQQPPLSRDVHVTVLWGPTGTGKSHRAMTTFPDAYVVRFSGARAGTAWDQYTNQAVVIFEEFDPADVPPHQLNSYLDKWKLSLNCRYNNKYAYYTHVVILTNLDPATWYPMFPALQRDALFRRLAAPIGQVFHVPDRDTVINFAWWIPTEPATPTPAPTPTLTQAPAAAAQAYIPRQASPSHLQPPLQRHNAGLFDSGWTPALFPSDTLDGAGTSDEPFIL